MEFNIEFEADISSSDENLIYEGLLAHNVEELGYALDKIRTKRFALLMRQEGEIKAGLVGHIKYTSAFIDTFWVEKSLRKKGLGRELLRRAEEYAKTQACTIVLLNTLSPANVHFYERAGYVLEFERPNYLGSYTMRYFRKVLVAD